MSINEQAAELVRDVNKTRYPQALQLATEILWQAERLEENRLNIKNAPIVMPYDNGGGQTGIRKNPMYDAYESLFASYTRGLKLLYEVLADTKPTTAAKNTLSFLESAAKARRIG